MGLKIPINAVIWDAEREGVKAPDYLIQAYRAESPEQPGLLPPGWERAETWEIGTPPERPGHTVWRVSTIHEGKEYGLEAVISDQERAHDTFKIFDADIKWALVNAMNRNFSERGFPLLTTARGHV